MKEEINLITNIRYLYDTKIDNKKDYRVKVAEYFNISISTARTGWFSNWEIPSKYRVQETLIEFTQKYINNQ